MTITSDIAISDLRALYWRVMYPEGLRLGLVLSLAGVVMLICLAGVDGPEFLGFLRFIGRLCLWVFLALSIGLIWTHLSSHRQWAGWMRATGVHAYTLEDRQLAVVDAEGRREFPTKAIKALDETPERIFIIMRKGPHYVIPRRALTGEEAEALKSFREAVAFASLHVDMLHRNQKPREEAASDFKLARWLAVGCLLVLPFTFGSGWLPLRALATAVLCAAVLLCSAVGLWRSRQRGFLAAVLFVWFLGPIFAGAREGSFRSEWGIQWLCITGSLTTLPLLMFPRIFRRLGRLEVVEPNETPGHNTGRPV